MIILSKIKRKIKAYSRWNKYYSKDERKINVPNLTIYEMLCEHARKHPEHKALNYFGKRVTFGKMLKQIDDVADSLMSLGVEKYDIVTVIMPNTPEALIAFYAINKVGAVSNIIHPLSSEVEIDTCLKNTESKIVIVIDASYAKINHSLKETKVEKIIGVSAGNSMPFYLKLGYKLSTIGKFKKPNKQMFMSWKKFLRLKSEKVNLRRVSDVREEPALILQSGGTTGVAKGIVLSNSSVNAMVLQAKVIVKNLKVQDRVLGILPVFHGFGLVLGIHTPLCLGCEEILIPRFKVDEFAKIINKNKPNVVFGVPTLYEGLLKNEDDNLDLSFLKYAICGGDSLSGSLQERINDYFKKHGAKITISQGYGMTESAAGVVINIDKSSEPGCIGIPTPGTDIKIVEPFSQKEVKDGEDGEICISGPTMMLGYLNNEEETNNVLQIHDDGYLWLHTGDIGSIDKNGMIFYKQRLKRMIITSGYNVYPKHIEDVIESHEAVLSCTVVGIPHPYKVEVAKACIVLKNDYIDTPIVRASIKQYCEKHLAKFEQPFKYDFRKSLPKTKMGKIDFKKLQEEE
ncbi:MAG: long-chain fatty acid--CoA ligase [Firmicutes bacterium]|nr:long-chain fatty acid--CoA ligase [Bacillota bacterium]